MFGFFRPERNATGPASEIDSCLLTDPGCQRESNEDWGEVFRPQTARVLEQRGILAVVADGMGGHQAGEVASRLAVETVGRVYYSSGSAPREALLRAFHEANRAVWKRARADERLSGMGATCTAVALHGSLACAAHVGDSRLYLVRAGGIYRLTEDHSAVMEMVKKGVLTLDEASRHEDRNVILRALGSHPEVNVSAWDQPLPTRPGDCFLLCSDGLHALVADEEMRAIVSGQDARAACQALIALARRRGGYDNITVGVLTFVTARRAAETRASEVIR